MAKNKTRKKKEFLIAQRKKVGPGYLDTPVWIIQKAGKRIWNRRQKRNWRQTSFGQIFLKQELDAKTQKRKDTRKSGKKTNSARFKVKKRRRNTSII